MTARRKGWLGPWTLDDVWETSTDRIVLQWNRKHTTGVIWGPVVEVLA